MKRLKVCFGPAWRAASGSWQWFGDELAQELTKYFDVSFFGHPDDVAPGISKKRKLQNILSPVKRADVTVVVKHRWSLKALADKAKVIYAPVDAFHDSEDGWRLADHFQNCAAIVAQSPTIAVMVYKLQATYYIPHHIRFYSDLQPYRETGPVLYVGVGHNLEFLSDWLARVKPDWPLLVLTKMSAKGAKAKGVFDRVEQWTPDRHMQALSECRAAIDIKGSSFWQLSKPSTKAMDFIASGLPFSINTGSDAYDEANNMLSEGVCSPKNTERWFSREYWEETAEASRVIRKERSLEATGLKWKEVIESV